MHDDPIDPVINFPLIEFRRYTIADGERDAFAHLFDTYFPEAFQQLGAFAFGQFLERDRTDRYTWVRGFRDSETRASACDAFYTGPVWKEHGPAMNRRLLDHTDVRLLAPLQTNSGMPALPAVDVLHELQGAQGIVLAVVFAAMPDAVDGLARRLSPVFEHCCNNGLRDAGLLTTFDGPNSFPRLPVREDGPFLVWLGLARDEAHAASAIDAFAAMDAPLQAEGLLREPPERIVLRPTARSRLRWRAT